MYNPSEDGGRRDGRETQPRQEQPAGTAPGVTYEFIGFDPSGEDIYRGSDGQLYRGDPNGGNGMLPYTGSGAGLSQTPPGPAGAADPTGAGTNTGGTGNTSTINGMLNFTPPPTVPFEDYPDFVPPTFTPPPAFQDPTMAEVENDPGYAFARDEGQRALEASKAAGGILNTGGTLKDIAAWANSFANTRYGDVRNRKRDTYMTNYQTQTLDPYHIAFNSALEAYKPNLSQAESKNAWNQHMNDMGWSNAFDVWRANVGDAFNYFTS